MIRTKVIAIILLMCLTLGCSVKEKALNDENSSNSETEISNPEDEKEITEMHIIEQKSAALDAKINSMTIEEKIGQLIMCAYRQDESGNNITVINENIKASMEEYNVGGVILFGENIDTKEQTQKLIKDLQNSSSIPLFIGIDEEGGRVSRLHTSGNIEAYDVPPAQEIGKEGDTNKAFEMGKIISDELRELGFNIDFAPIADINTNPKNTVIGERAYSSDPVIASDMVEKAMEGLQYEPGLYAVAKHFPGHGDTSTDSHTGEVVIDHDLNRLEEVEFLPFKRLIDKGISFIMVGHIKTPNVSEDGLPASMSKTLITDILKNKLGFKGIVITDALNMGAISQYYECGEVAVQAINAGVDILLMPEDTGEAFNAVLSAVNTGTITEERINESVKKILAAKCEANIVEIDNYDINFSK